MKRINLLMILLAGSILILAACGGDDIDATTTEEAPVEETQEMEYEPDEIDPEVDICEVCGMAIADDEHATQIILENERSLKFDDIGDLFVWIEENGEDEVGAKFVRDFNTLEWILLEDATFVYHDEISTPMGFGVISFEDREEADSYIEENGFGERLSATDLESHEWEMDHDHGDHDHNHHDHDHGEGFHTEGFDMEVTELEEVETAEEVILEVMITLDEEALENADVRYEIWPEDDKDNTDWVDTEEASPGNYRVAYTFDEALTYHIQIHVEDDEDLHEHMEYEVDVKE